MITFSIVVLVIIFLVCCQFVFGSSKLKFVDVNVTKTREASQWESAKYENDIKLNIPMIITGIVLLIAAIKQPLACERIDAGTIGLLENLSGSQRGISSVKLVSGWQFYNSYTQAVHEIPADNKAIHYEAQQVNVKGGFTCTIKPSFVYKVVDENVIQLFVDYRQTFKSLGLVGVQNNQLEIFVSNAITDVTSRYSIDSIFNYRENFEHEIDTEVKKRVGKYFSVTGFKSNIVPPAALVNSLEEKTKAVQEKQTFDLRALRAESEAKEKVAIAQGEYQKAQLEVKTKELMSQPPVLALYRAETDRIWAQSGKSPYGEGNVFGTVPNLFMNK